MASTWIKMRTDLHTDPAVIATALATGLSEDEIVGKLHRIWSWADANTSNGHVPGVTFEWLDRYAGVTQFANILETNGWLQRDKDGYIIFPKFDNHMSESGKRRSQAQKRMKRYRGSVTEASPKAQPEKRREEKNNKSTKVDLCKTQNDKPKAKRERDHVWDSVVLEFWPSGVPASQRARVGRVVRDLKQLGVKGQLEIRARVEAYKQKWPNMDCTPEALIKHWDQVTKQLGGGGARTKTSPDKYKNSMIRESESDNG